MSESRNWLILKIAANRMALELFERELAELGAEGLEVMNRTEYAAFLREEQGLDEEASKAFEDNLPDVLYVRAFFLIPPGLEDEEISRFRLQLETKLSLRIEHLNAYLPAILEALYGEDWDISSSVHPKDKEHTKYTGYSIQKDEQVQKRMGGKLYQPIDPNLAERASRSWDEYQENKKDNPIRTDGAGAVGDQLPDSTLLCIRELPDLLVSGNRVLNLGGDFGLLTLAAQRLGNMVDSVTFEKMALDAAQSGNGNPEVVTNLLKTTLHKAPRSHYDLLMGCLPAKAFTALAGAMRKMMSLPGYLLISGFTTEESLEVKKIFLANGFTIVRERTLEGWSALVFRSAEQM